jgi:hypothetical protein
VSDRGERAEELEAARRKAAAAHEAVGDAEDDLAAAEAKAAVEAEGSIRRGDADARVEDAERAWLERQTDAQDATVARDALRDADDRDA